MSKGDGSDKSLTIKRKQDNYFQSSQFIPFDSTTDEERNAVLDRVNEVSRSAEKSDTLSYRLEKYSKDVMKGSSWLNKRKIPDKKTIGDEIDKAAKAFGISQLSSSQRSKRGKRFIQKAKLQADMINLANLCRWERDESLDDLMRHGMYARLGTDMLADSTMIMDRPRESSIKAGAVPKPTYMRNVDVQIDQYGTMLRDLSFYYDLKARDEYTPGRVDPGLFHYDIIEKIADENRRNDGYRLVTHEFMLLDISQFDYENNNDFLDNHDHSFERRYASLRAFSHMSEILDELEEHSGAPMAAEQMLQCRAKAQTVKEILKDYETRMIMLQSPYYTLLAGKDVNSFSDKDLRERMGKTEDPLIKAFIGRVLEKRSRQGFGAGKKARSIYEKNLKALKKKK